MASAIEISALSKQYGSVTALDGVDLIVPEGSVFGFLGRNGAGKTTTLRILNGLAKPTAGSVRVLGHDAGSREACEAVGFLPDVPGFYDWMSASEFLRFTGGLFGIPSSKLAERVEVLIDLAGLTGVSTRVGGFSRGMKQRLGIAQALINAPRLLMLDEPTSALDPLGRRDVLEMIASLADRTTVFFSTHILADVERVCDSVAVLERGRIVAQAPIAELKARYGTHRVEIEVDRASAALAEALAARDWVSDVVREDESRVVVTVSDLAEAGREVPRLLTEHDVGLTRYEPGEVGLEEVFLQLVGEAAGVGS